jgi:hypothetical protein
MIHEESNPGSIKVVPPYSLLLSIFGSSQKRRENTKKSKIYSKEKKKLIAVRRECQSAKKMIKNWLRRLRNTKIEI